MIKNLNIFTACDSTVDFRTSRGVKRRLHNSARNYFKGKNEWHASMSHHRSKYKEKQTAECNDNNDEQETTKMHSLLNCLDGVVSGFIVNSPVTKTAIL